MDVGVGISRRYARVGLTVYYFCVPVRRGTSFLALGCLTIDKSRDCQKRLLKVPGC